MNEKVFVTGGAGYIGAILVPALLKEGFSVTVFDSLRYKQQSLLDCCNNTNFEFIKGDICDFQMINRLLPNFDIVIPLAAIVGAPACSVNPTNTKHVNEDAQMNIVENVSSEQKVLFPNTNSGYGIGKQDDYCTEESPLNPISEYGKAKVKIEKAFLNKGGAISFRLATVFGMSPRMRLDLLVNDFVYRAVNDKVIVLFEEHFRRNYVHIRDVASAFIFGIQHYDKMRDGIYNLGLPDANLTKRQLCEKIKEYVGTLYIHSAEIGEDPDKRDYLVSNKKIEALGWRPEHSIDGGIRELIKGCSLLRWNNLSND